MKRPLSELVEIEKKLNKGRGSENVKSLCYFVERLHLSEAKETFPIFLSKKWDVLRQYPEVIQWFKDNGLEPK